MFKQSDGFVDLPVTLPCGQCIGCRLERSRQWAIRCHHEASLYENNSFITLTYNDLYLPDDWSLNVRHFQLFMKRLRKKYLKTGSSTQIRFFHCGEYGETYGRPHYHALLFNHDWEDKYPWKMQNNQMLYRSEQLESLWSDPVSGESLGYCSTGAVTFQSAAYVARYIMKKVTGTAAAQHYEWVDDWGQIHNRKPEYTTMSRRPGIGKAWFDAYAASDMLQSDHIVINGVRMKPPKYYDKQFEIVLPSDFQKTKLNRIRQASKHKENQTPERLKVREKVQKARLKNLPRNLDQH